MGGRNERLTAAAGALGTEGFVGGDVRDIDPDRFFVGSARGRDILGILESYTGAAAANNFRDDAFICGTGC
jgi:hypothetical protein